MTMATKCTGCGTTFRVTPEQLKAHQGRVRCGRCMAVFDGLGNLITLPETPAAGVAPATPPEPPPGALTPALPEEPVHVPTETQPEPQPQAYDAGGDVASPEAFELEPVTEPLPEPAPVVAETPDMAPVANLTPGLPFDEPMPEYPAAPRRRWPWVLGALLALVALLAQAAYLFRADIAAQYPPLKPLLVQLCDYAGCRVVLPQQPKLINIEASDLQAVDPTRPGLIRVTATLRNHASHDLGYPALDLVLTNTRDHALARRIFMPEEYLERGRDPSFGIPAKGEITIRIDVETGDLGAAGFRLDLLPAPAR
jgi:predicted Zn finger-like uncharacterized protein